MRLICSCLLSLAAPAHADVLSVPGEHPTLQAALDASTPGDIIEVAAGSYAGPFDVDRAVTIRGAGVGQTLPIAGLAGPTVGVTLSSPGEQVVLESVTLKCSSDGALHQAGGRVRLADSELSGCAALPSTVDGAVFGELGVELHVRRTTLVGGTGGAPAVAARGQELRLSDLSLDGGTYAGAALFHTDQGSLDVQDVRVGGVSVHGPLFRGVSLTRADLSRVELPCNTVAGPLILLDADEVTIDALLAWKNDVGGSVLDLAGDVTLSFATVLGRPEDTLVSLRGPEAVLHSVALAHASFAVDAHEYLALDVSYSLLGAGGTGHVDDGHLAGPGVAFEAPELWSLSSAPGCGGDQLAPLPGGNLVDAGKPGLSDPDGSPADIGATGGPSGLSLAVSDDADGDGYASATLGGDDCDDLDAIVHPGAVEDLTDVDRDCDGHTDPALPLRPLGCSHAPASGAVAGWLLAAFAIARPRRTHFTNPEDRS